MVYLPEARMERSRLVLTLSAWARPATVEGRAFLTRPARKS